MTGQSNEELLRGLANINPRKPLGTPLFDALAKVTVSIGVEAVCIRQNPENGDIEVYMTQRPKEKTAYPGEWHCPGSVMRPGEEFSDIFDRLSQKEFGGKIRIIQFVANVNNPDEKRGHFLSIVYLCVIDGEEATTGSWFSVKNLPEETVTHHRLRIIPAAVGAFVATNSSVK